MLVKGLQFIPTPTHRTRAYDLDEGFEEFHRKVCLRFMFAGEDRTLQPPNNKNLHDKLIRATVAPVPAAETNDAAQ